MLEVPFDSEYWDDLHELWEDDMLMELEETAMSLESLTSACASIRRNQHRPFQNRTMIC